MQTDGIRAKKSMEGLPSMPYDFLLMMLSFSSN